MDGQVNTPKLLKSILIIHYSNSWPGKLKTPKNILCNNSVYSDISDIRVFSRCNWVSKSRSEIIISMWNHFEMDLSRRIKKLWFSIVQNRIEESWKIVVEVTFF